MAQDSAAQACGDCRALYRQRRIVSDQFQMGTCGADVPQPDTCDFGIPAERHVDQDAGRTCVCKEARGGFLIRKLARDPRAAGLFNRVIKHCRGDKKKR